MVPVLSVIKTFTLFMFSNACIFYQNSVALFTTPTDAGVLILKQHGQAIIKPATSIDKSVNQRMGFG
jgi:hypothetical protein